MCEPIDPRETKAQEVVAYISGFLFIIAFVIWMDIETAGPTHKDDGIGLLPSAEVYQEHRESRQQQWLNWSGITHIVDYLILTR